MKKTVLLYILMCAGFLSGAQDIFQQLTDKYAKEDGFSATRITEDMFDLYLRKKNVEEDSPVYETLKGLDHITVASLNKFGAQKGMNLEDLHTELLKHYSESGYTLFKTEKQMGEDVKVYLQKRGEKVGSLALITASSASVNLIEMNGDVNMSGLSQLSSVLNVRGLENLNKINGGSSWQVMGSTLTLPEFRFQYPQREFFDEEKIRELREQIREQRHMTEEQRMLLEEKAREMVQKQSEMAEKYRQMEEMYGRKPIFLTAPGDTNAVYYIDGEKVTAKAVKELAPDDIESIQVNKTTDKEKGVIRIKTKKR
jgi:hypothetical protein